MKGTERTYTHRRINIVNTPKAYFFLLSRVATRHGNLKQGYCLNLEKSGNFVDNLEFFLKKLIRNEKNTCTVVHGLRLLLSELNSCQYLVAGFNEPLHRIYQLSYRYPLICDIFTYLATLHLGLLCGVFLQSFIPLFQIFLRVLRFLSLQLKHETRIV